MKAVQVLALLGLVSVSLAQDPGPSPTNSIGCEPHDDHWHCEGPLPTETPAEDDHDDDHEEAVESSVDPGPSPTASVGCEPHGDHWHCEGPATTETPAPGDDEHDHEEDGHDDHDDHDDESSVDPGPSPTASVGCEPHGDHWHCEGPVETDTVSVSITGSATESSAVPTESVVEAAANGIPIAGAGAVLAAAAGIGAVIAF